MGHRILRIGLFLKVTGVGRLMTTRTLQLHQSMWWYDASCLQQWRRQRVRIITSNDNLEALRFYQRWIELAKNLEGDA